MANTDRYAESWYSRPYDGSIQGRARTAKMSEQSREITRESEVDHYVDAEGTLLTVIPPHTLHANHGITCDNIITTECNRGAVLLNVD